MMDEKAPIRLLLVFLLAAFFGLNSNAWADGKAKFDFPVNQQLKVMGSYRIRFDETNALLANVEAKIAVKDGQIFMAPWGADHLPGGWASFVKNIKTARYMS